MDRQIAAANADGVAVILGLYQAYPAFSHEGNNIPPPRTSTTDATKRFAADQQVCDNVTANGPWGWFINYLLSRYKRGVPANTPGPRASNQFGNPIGASIHSLEIVNEPNFSLYPQVGMPRKVADMTVTAAQLADAAGWPATGQFLLAPGISDYTDTANANLPTTVAGVQVRSNYDTFAQNVLSLLPTAARFSSTYVGWSQHNYYDVKYPFASTASPNSRAQKIQQLLGTRPYQGGTYQGTEQPRVADRGWLPEGEPRVQRADR